MGRPEDMERRVSRVEVPVEVTGWEAGLMPCGRAETEAEAEAEGEGEGLLGLLGVLGV